MTIFPVTMFGLQMSFHIDILVFPQSCVGTLLRNGCETFDMDGEAGGLQGGWGLEPTTMHI